MATNKISYRVFYFTLYSLGLRLSEGLHLELCDITYMDVGKGREQGAEALTPCVNVFISAIAPTVGALGEGNKDRLVPLPDATVNLLRRYWRLHRHPVLLFPNRKRGLEGAHHTTTPMDSGGVQAAMRQVVQDCGKKKTLPHTAGKRYGRFLETTNNFKGRQG